MAETRRTKILTHLWYAKEAEEAAKLYTSIFPDSRIDHVATLPSDSPSGPAGSVKVVDFTLFGQPLRAMSAGPHHDFNDAMSLVVSCDDQAELDRYWNALLETGGKAQACGWLIDRFGVRWQIVPAAFEQMMRDRDVTRTKKVTDAMPSSSPGWYQLHRRRPGQCRTAPGQTPRPALCRRQLDESALAPIRLVGGAYRGAVLSGWPHHFPSRRPADVRPL